MEKNGKEKLKLYKKNLKENYNVHRYCLSISPSSSLLKSAIHMRWLMSAHSYAFFLFIYHVIKSKIDIRSMVRMSLHNSKLHKMIKALNII